MLNRIWLRICFVGMGMVSGLTAMTYDNPYLPFGIHHYTHTHDRYSAVMPEAFMLFAHEARCGGVDEDLYALFGGFDLDAIGFALQKLGQSHPVRSAWRGIKLPWHVKGKLEGVGVSLVYHQALTDHFSTRASILAMKLRTQPQFELDKTTIANIITTEAEFDELERARLAAAQQVGVCQFATSEYGLGDLDLAVRYGLIKDYPYKFRRVDIGLSGGVLVPTGKKHHINKPYSIAFGGNGHWGLYGALDLELELKEDMKAGVWVRVSKRLAQNVRTRIPVAGEPFNFAPLIDLLHIDPGTVLVVSPFLILDDLRDGLGASLQYTYIKKFSDLFTDLRKDQSVPATFHTMRVLSRWTSQQLSMRLFYDFGRQVIKRSWAPIISATWDIPVQFIGKASHAAKSHRLSIGVELHY